MALLPVAMWRFVVEAWRVIDQVYSGLVLAGLVIIIPLIIFGWLSTKRDPKERSIARARRSVNRARFLAKPRLARVLLRFATVWAALVLLVNLAAVYGLFLGSKGILDGFRKVRDMYDPFQFGTYLINGVLLAPAVLAYMWAERIESGRSKSAGTAEGPICPECGSTDGIYWFSDEQVPKAGDYGPCVKCFNGLIYESPGGSLKLSKLTSKDLQALEAFSAEDLAAPLLPSPGRRAANPAAKKIFNFLLVRGTPAENQKELLTNAIFEVSRLLPSEGDAFVSFAAFLSGLPFEARSSLLMLLLSKAPDEEKRKLLLSLANRPKTG